MDNRFIAALPLGAFRTRAENDGLICADAAGHVDLFHAFVMGQIIPDLGASIRKAQKTGLDKRSE